MPRWAALLAGLLAAIFLATGLGKMLDVPGFAAILGEYRLFPQALLLPLAVAIVLGEFAVVAGLLLPAFRARAALAAGAFATLNFVVLSITLLRGIELQNCGCFGVFLARPLTPLTPVEDLVLLALSVVVWRQARQA